MTSFVIGINPTAVRTSTEGPEFALGTLGTDDQMPTLQSAAIGVTGGSGGSSVPQKIYRYCKIGTGGLTGAGYIVAIDPATEEAIMPVAATGDAGTGMFKPVGVGCAAVAASGYGWVQVYGACVLEANAAAAKFTRLAVTATAGEVDDATGATLNWVEGAIFTATATGAGSFAGHVNWPYLGLKSA